ncbi:DUF6522 family protein [Brevundimonas sp.]|uniref:DUF6522 family protein n=1 Tax=Brevundimonas sp. TaxID=1871086 RepID=UPI003563BFCB
MSSVPKSAISIEGGEIIIDAELLAFKLGVSAASLQAGMPKGIVSTVAETGIDEDAGRTRLTFRYRSRTWTVVVDTDGSLVESIAPAPKPLPAKTGRLSLSEFVRRGS